MLGLLRYLLALMVVFSHLWPQTAWWQGTYAVFGFYVISGYLMTLVLNGNYQGEGGWRRYAINRLLRIFPPYVVVFLFSVTLLALAPWLLVEPVDLGLAYGQVVRTSESLSDWALNLTLVLPWSNQNFSVSQAWSLRVELVFYALMIVLVKWRPVVLTWLLVSLALVYYQHTLDLPFIDRYTSLAGSSLAFALGSCVWHWRDRLALAPWQLWLSTGVFFLHAAFAAEIWGFERLESFAHFFRTGSYGLYLSTILAAWMLAAIVSNTRAGAARVPWSDWLGNLAYPIFLCHWLIAGLMLSVGVSFDDKPVLIPLSLLGIHLLAYAIYVGIERPIDDHVRKRVRNQSREHIAAT